MEENCFVGEAGGTPDQECVVDDGKFLQAIRQGRGNEGRMSGSCLTTISHIWNQGLQLGLIILIVLVARPEWDNEKNQRNQRPHHFSLNNSIPIPEGPRALPHLTPPPPNRKLRKG